MNYGQAKSLAELQSNSVKEQKGTAVDSINAVIESLTSRADALARFSARISDGLLGVVPSTTVTATDAPRAVTQSTNDYIRDLEAAFERLSSQINRLG